MLLDSFKKELNQSTVGIKYEQNLNPYPKFLNPK